MITGKLKDIIRYKGLNTNLDKAIDYILNNDLNNLSMGLTNIYSQDVFINRFDYKGLDEAECFFEGHKNYLDIHILLSGSELFGYSDISELNQVTEYDSESDFIKFEGKVKDYIKLEVGDFIIVFPEDVHMPKIKINDDLIKKAVCKVLV